MKSVFITGTDTGVGKTVITGLLAKFLLDKGLRVVTQKWVTTGSARRFSGDVRMHLKIMGKRLAYIKKYVEDISPYILKHASSPHLAARLEGIKIDAGKIRESFRRLKELFDFVIVEGAGGALVPYDERRFILDMVKNFGTPVLIVAGNKLGAINHTLLTVRVIKSKKVRLLGIIFNNIKDKVDTGILRDNPRIVGKLTGETILGTLPRIKNRKLLYRKFIPIGEKIYKKIKWTTG